MVSLNDLYLVVTSGPVVSIVGTTRVGMVPAEPGFRKRPQVLDRYSTGPTIGVDPTVEDDKAGSTSSSSLIATA
jgi:hypothetical protein